MNTQMNLGNALIELVNSTGFVLMSYKELIMIGIALFFIYLAIVKKYEPLLLLPIGFGMLLVNLPGSGIMSPPVFDPSDPHSVTSPGGLLYYLYQGVKLGIYPPLIFLGVGAMTDFGPLIANPKTLLLGAAAQFGIFGAFIGAILLGFDPAQASSIGIIGGADGPTAIYVTSQLAPELLGPIAVAAYSYMGLVPIIQPPIMKAMTTKAQRGVVMAQLRKVSQVEKIIFPIMVTILVTLLLPTAAPLVGMLMLGNLFRESGVVERLNETAQNNLINIVTIFLGVSVGATASADKFLNVETLLIVVLGLMAFALGTAAGTGLGLVFYKLSGGKINPLIGSAGVSAVPMAARVAQVVGQEANPRNFLLMHAMGPNVAGVIGSAVAAGALLSMFGS